MTLISAALLTPYAAGFSQAGIARQAAAWSLSTALDRLSGISSDSAALTSTGWTCANLQARISADPLGVLRTTLLALLDLGEARDSTAAALFGVDLSATIIHIARAFALAQLISADALASE